MAAPVFPRAPWYWLVLVVIFGGAIYGRPDSPSARPPGSHDKSPPKPGEIRELPTCDFDRRNRLNEPIRRYLDVLSPGGIDSNFAAQLAGHNVSYLIVTVADPIDSEENYRFDTQLDTLHMALAADANDPRVVDRFYSPWQVYRERQKAKPEVALVEEEHIYRREPGVLVYRKTHLGTDEQMRGDQGHQPPVANPTGFPRHDILLVLLVGEQPTTGIHRPAFRLAVDQIQQWEKARGQAAEEPARPRNPTISVAGPTFTGSAASLATMLRECVQQARDRTDPEPQFEVITGSATGIDADWFRRMASVCPSQVRFGATVRHGDEVEQALGDYLTTRAKLSLIRRPRIAWLVESSTVFGASARSNPGKMSSSLDSTYFYFPLHISQVRNFYEQRRHEEPLQPPSIAPLPGTASPLPFDAADGTRDLPDTMTPTMTGPEVELLLAQILNTIDREGFQYVGISATDVRDPIFLADKIHEHCPQVQIVLREADILHTHPQYRGSLSGAILATTYPLVADAQEWCYPFRYSLNSSGLVAQDRGEPGQARPALLHPNDSCAGLYNAVILLRALARGRGQPRCEPNPGMACWPCASNTTIDVQGYLPLWCYGPPHQFWTNPLQPSSWISALGTDTAWPVAAYAPPDASSTPTQSYTIAIRHTDPEHRSHPIPRELHFTSPFLPFLTLLCVTIAGTLFYFLRFPDDTQEPTASPKHWRFEPGRKHSAPREVSALGFVIAGATILLACSCGTLAKYLCQFLWPADCIAQLLYIAHWLIAIAGLVISIRLLRAYFGNVWQAATGKSLFFANLLMFLIIFWSVVGWSGSADGQRFQMLSLGAVVNGVSPILSTTLAAGATMALGLAMLHQHFLVASAKREWPEYSGSSFNFEQLLNPLRRVTVGAQPPAGHGSKRRPTVVVLIGATILPWIVIALATVNVGISPVRTCSLFLLIAFASVLWWWLLIEAFMVGRQLLKELHESHKIWLNEDPPFWKSTFEELGRDEVKDLGRFLYGPRPHANDRVARLIQQPRTSAPESALRALRIYRIAQIVGKHLWVSVKGLAVAALLIFLAVVGFPFNTAPSMRFMLFTMLLAAAGSLGWMYLRLDRDPMLSHMLGSKPHSIAWTGTLALNVGLVVSAVLIAVVAQLFPGVWVWLWSAVQSGVGVTG